jgi:hypothetical protein
MTLKRPSGRAVLIGVLLIAGLLHGLDGSPSQVLPVHAYGSSAGSEAAIVPGEAVLQTHPARNGAATAADGTLAAILAAELLLSPSSFYVDLPLVAR